MGRISKDIGPYPWNLDSFRDSVDMYKIVEAMRKLIDPSTKSATAFYCLLGIAGWDVITRGFNKFNAALLAGMALPGIVGVIAQVFGSKPGDTKES